MKYYFSQAFEWAEILNPQISLANHPLMASPCFYDRVHVVVPKFSS